jgi:hypothetical protein
MCLRGRLYDRDRKIRSYTLFFRANEILPPNESIRQTIKPIQIRPKARLIREPIPIKKREKRNRR